MTGGGLALLGVAAIGLIGCVRAFSRPVPALIKWHGIVFLGVPAVYLALFSSKAFSLPAKLAAPIVLVTWFHWLLSGVEVYVGSAPGHQSLGWRRYLQILAALFAFAAALAIFAELIGK